MLSLNTTKSASLPTKTTHGKTTRLSTGTTFDSTNFMTTDSTSDTPSPLTSGISPNGFVNTKLSSSPLTSAVTKQWPFVTIPVGKRRRIFRINKFSWSNNLEENSIFNFESWAIFCSKLVYILAVTEKTLFYWFCPFNQMLTNQCMR